MSDSSRSAAPGGARVLVVEDSPDQAYLLSRLLRQLGPYDMSLAQDGIHALELAASRSFDLLITDLNLPGMDGFTLTHELKARQPGVAVIAVTGYQTPAHVDGARRAGADAVLLKPLDRDVLYATVLELLPGSAEVDQGATAVVAVGLQPGDVELGCGGSLAAHEAAGHAVHRVVLSAMGDPVDALGQAMELLRDVRPRVVYLPSPRDTHPERGGLLERLRPALQSVPSIMGYATATTSLDFRPSTYRAIGAHLAAKLDGLESQDDERASDTPTRDFALAHARYWGRFADFDEVEPFELLRNTTSPHEPLP